MSVVNIKGRYGTVTCQLTQIDESRWRLQTESGFCRFGMFPESEEGRVGLSFCDPSGGPFIALGSTLSDFDKRLPEKMVTGIHSTEEGIVLAVS